MRIENHQEGVRRLEEFVSSIKYGEPQAYKNLIVFPLYTDVITEGRYMLLSEAMKTDKFRVVEVSEGGSVPELHVINELDVDVLILEGEILKGAKQDRTVNTTIIVGKGSKVNMSVSCVEAGRWSYRSREFRDAVYSADRALRRDKTRSVSESLRDSGSYRSDQGRIWDEISRRNRRMNFHSESSCVTELYESRETQYKEYEKGFSCTETQTGIAVFTNATLSGCDIFGIKGLMQRSFRKILSGYIFEGIDKSILGEKGKEADYTVLRNKLDTFFKDIAAMPKEVFKSRGEGYDIRFDRADITGFAIEHDSNIIQMAGFYFDEAEWKFQDEGKRDGGHSGDTFGNDRYYQNRIRRVRRGRQ